MNDARGELKSASATWIETPFTRACLLDTRAWRLAGHACSVPWLGMPVCCANDARCGRVRSGRAFRRGRSGRGRQTLAAGVFILQRESHGTGKQATELHYRLSPRFARTAVRRHQARSRRCRAPRHANAGNIATQSAVGDAAGRLACPAALGRRQPQLRTSAARPG
jgi:hypothetical protein